MLPSDFITPQAEDLITRKATKRLAYVFASWLAFREVVQNCKKVGSSPVGVE